MSPKEINDYIIKLFSSEGIDVNGYKIKADSPLIVEITNNNNLTEIKFGSNLPKAEITRIITIYAYIEGLVFGECGGTVKLRNFPDLSFSYDSGNCETSSSLPPLSEINNDIETRYSEKSHKEIASKCLQYAEEWATICHQSGITFENADYADRYNHYNNCYDFVEENIKKDVENRHGSVILTWLFVYVVLPMIIKLIVNKVLERLFND